MAMNLSLRTLRLDTSCEQKLQHGTTQQQLSSPETICCPNDVYLSEVVTALVEPLHLNLL